MPLPRIHRSRPGNQIQGDRLQTIRSLVGRIRGFFINSLTRMNADEKQGLGGPLKRSPLGNVECFVASSMFNNLDSNK